MLGPGLRAVLWVQGCGKACPGCLAPESWARTGGFSRSVSDLVAWVVAQDEIEGLTVSGGEPMDQAAPLAELLEECRKRRDLGLICYTGYSLEQLDSPAHLRLLSQVDLLIDGPYRQELHADLLWRGSSNQRILNLSQRYSLPGEDRSAGLEFEFLGDGKLSFAGVPPWPAFPEGAPFR